VFHCAIKRRIKGGRAKETGKTGRRRRWMRAEEALEVGGGADMRGQAVSHWREKGGGVLGRGEEMGREREVGRRERKKKERGRRAAGLGREEGRWAAGWVWG
jgi:hypothetical protein